MQQAYLLEEDTVDVRFMGVYHDDNAKELTASVDLLAGKALAGFWDRCEKAGSQKSIRKRLSPGASKLGMLVSGGWGDQAL